MITVKFKDNGIYCINLLDICVKRFRRKDAYFKYLKKQIEKGTIIFDDEHTDTNHFIQYKDLKERDFCRVRCDSLTDVEKSLFSNLINYSKSLSVKNKSEELSRIQGPKSKSYVYYLKKYYMELCPFTPPFLNNPRKKFTLFCITIWYALTITIAICSHYNEQLTFTPSFAISLPAIAGLVVPAITSLIKADRAISNDKYKLSVDEFSKVNENKKKKRKTKEEKKLDYSRELLTKIENENIPNIEDEVVRELDEVYKLINGIEDRSVKQEYLLKLLGKINEYKGKETIKVGSDTILEIASKQCNAAELLVFLEGFKREILNVTRQNIVEKKINELETLISDEVREEVTDDMQNGNVMKL